jgi:hypothetical protein
VPVVACSCLWLPFLFAALFAPGRKFLPVFGSLVPAFTPGTRPQVDGFALSGRLMRASFGTTKYCNAFLRHAPCTNPDCLYLHDLGDDEVLVPTRVEKKEKELCARNECTSSFSSRRRA